VFGGADDDGATLIAALPSLMADVAVLDVPLLVEAGMGDNWDEAH